MIEKNLHDLYQTEKQILIEHMKSFSQRYPQVALRLKMQEGVAYDPLVSQLLDAFAFTSARLQYKNHVDMQFIFEAFLQELFPQLLLPVPAFSMVSYQVSELTEPGGVIPAQTVMYAEKNDLQAVTVQSCYSVEVYPIKISHRHCHHLKASTMNVGKMTDCLEIEIVNLHTHLTLSQQNMNKLTFFLNLSFDRAGELYQLFFLHCQGITLSGHATQDEIYIPLSSLKSKRWQADASLFPGSKKTAESIWVEYFAYTEKFHFITIDNLSLFDKGLEKIMILRFYFSKSLGAIKSEIQLGSLQLFCTPVINWVSQFSDPIRLDREFVEFPVAIGGISAESELTVVDVESIEAYGVYSREPLAVLPFFLHRYAMPKHSYLRWYFRRKQDTLNQIDRVFLGVKSCGSPIKEEVVVVAKLRCMQKNILHLPHQILTLNSTFAFSVSEATVLKSFTVPQGHTIQPSSLLIVLRLLRQKSDFFSGDLRYSLLTLLSCFTDDDYYEGIVDLKVTVSAERHQNPLRFGFVMGKQVQLIIDESKFPTHQLFIFAEVLHHYLLLLAPLNTFIKMSLLTLQNGLLKNWPATFGVGEEGSNSLFLGKDRP